MAKPASFFLTFTSKLMSLLNSLSGPKSKHKKHLPYTYEAQIDRLNGLGSKEDLTYFYADTLCALIHYLDEQNIEPKNVRLIAFFKDEEIPIDTQPMTKDHKWLKRPALCRSLEQHYQATQLKEYVGHEMHSDCEFSDRDRRVL